MDVQKQLNIQEAKFNVKYLTAMNQQKGQFDLRAINHF